ncbi:hypothetical protein PIB30_058422 [Stylosanthes scabra]|uniref:Uncharacterized protein n=1 Tax=Stylosanthes scabra TaxID=79078 RepID=A0ABU6VIZ0_9FABA|nr:hypothetical protein [Stylosanthes scabra]
MASICWKLCNISSKNTADYREISSDLLKLISKVQKRRDVQSKLPPTSKIVGDPAVVKTKGAPRKFPNGQKRRRCLHCRSTKHNIRTCPNLSNKKDSVDREEESFHPEFEDDLTVFTSLNYTMVEESETNDLVDTQESTPAKATPMQSSINDKTKVISSSEATLEEKTDTQGIEVEKVETTTSNLELPKYHLHHIPWIYPYQPNSGAMPTPIYPFYSGLPFPHHSHNIGTPPYPQFSHVSPNSSASCDDNTWVGLLDEISKNAKS